MRIVAGTLKGRRLEAPRGRSVRPTSDRLRETLFNVLGASVVGARVLDGFAGTGAIGLEALSRGARAVTFAEREPAVADVIARNLASCGVAGPCAIIRGDFLKARRHDSPFDLVLLDPPYDFETLEDVVMHGTTWAADSGRIVLEHSRRRASPDMAGRFHRYRVLTAGDSALSFYAPSPVIGG